MSLLFNVPSETLKNGRKRFRFNTAIINIFRRMKLVQTGKLPIAEPVNGPEQATLFRTLGRWIRF